MLKRRPNRAHEHGQIDILINGAWQRPKATTNPDQRFFDLPLEACRPSPASTRWVRCCRQVFARPMAGAQGVVLNISSVNAARPLTRIAAYSASKAAISNFTQWLAIHLAQGTR